MVRCILSEQFGMTEATAGYLFIPMDIGSCGSTLLVGLLIDEYPQYRLHIVSVGFFVSGVGALLLGPVSHLKTILPPWATLS